MWGEAWANLALKVFSWTTDEQGLAKLRLQLEIAGLEKEIKNAIKHKNFALAASKLDDLKRLSNAA